MSRSRAGKGFSSRRQVSVVSIFGIVWLRFILGESNVQPVCRPMK